MTQQTPSRHHEWFAKAMQEAARLPSRVLPSLDGWHDRARLQHELIELDTRGELDHVLSDAGISRCDVWRLVHGHPGAARHFTEMLRRLGVDEAAAPGAELRELQWNCNDCQTWRECRDWLAAPAEDEAYREFCPNAAAFEQMAVEQPAQGHPDEAEPGRPGGILQDLDENGGQLL